MKTTETGGGTIVISPWKAAGAGAVAGVLAGIVMTTVMLLLARMFGVATPLALMGDRLSVFIPVDTFLELMAVWVATIT